MKSLPFWAAAAVVLLAACPARAADARAEAISEAASLARLKAGNERFVRQPMSSAKPTAARRTATAKGQRPFAIIVACADSRTAPEIVFDQNIGDLFVVRTAGNLVDDYALGSIEYAVEHLGARLIVVLGHERCGAVQAALSGGDASGHVADIVGDMADAVRAARERGGNVLANAIRENELRVAEKIRDEAELGPLSKKVQILTATYDLDSGKVEWGK